LQEVVAGFGGVEGKGEAGVGVFGEGLLGVVALEVKVVDDLLKEDFLQANFDLLGSQDTPSVGGELGDEEGLVGGLRGEVVEEALFEGFEFGGVFEREDGEFGGEAMLDGVQTGVGFAGGGAGAGGFFGILLTCLALGFGDGSRHEIRVTWGFSVGRICGGWAAFVLLGLGWCGEAILL